MKKKNGEKNCHEWVWVSVFWDCCNLVGQKKVHVTFNFHGSGAVTGLSKSLWQ